MGQKLYEHFDGGIRVIDGRKLWDVDIPAHVYDIWMPLIGTDTIGIFGFLMRVARNNKTERLRIKDMAKACRKNDTTFKGHLEKLKVCGFIKMKTPNERERKRGVRTVILIKDPPRVIPDALIVAYSHNNDPKNYRPITSWLIKEEDHDSREDDIEWDKVKDENLGAIWSQAGLHKEPNLALNGDLSIDPSVGPSPSFNAGRQERPAVQGITGYQRRTLKIDRGGATTNRDAAEKSKLSATDAGFPPLGRLILSLLVDSGTDQSTLTQKQIDLLNEPVIHPHIAEPQPSPNQYLESHTQAFKAWIQTIPDMPWVQKKRGSGKLTAGTVIDAIRGYHFYNGWYYWLGAGNTEPEPEEQKPDVQRPKSAEEVRRELFPEEYEDD